MQHLDDICFTFRCLFLHRSQALLDGTPGIVEWFSGLEALAAFGVVSNSVTFDSKRSSSSIKIHIPIVPMNPCPFENVQKPYGVGCG